MIVVCFAAGYVLLGIALASFARMRRADNIPRIDGYDGP